MICCGCWYCGAAYCEYCCCGDAYCTYCSSKSGVLQRSRPTFSDCPMPAGFCCHFERSSRTFFCRLFFARSSRTARLLLPLPRSSPVVLLVFAPSYSVPSFSEESRVDPSELPFFSFHAFCSVQVSSFCKVG